MKIEEAYRQVYDCPFCGNTPQIEVYGPPENYVEIGCEYRDCKATVYVRGDMTLKEAVNIWNDRK